MTRLTTLDRSLNGRVGIVTGAASGMGRATAHLFADEGAHVAVVDLDEARVREVVDEIVAVHGTERASAHPLDVTDRRALVALVDSVVAGRSRLDFLVNNAGVSLLSHTEQPEDEFRSTWDRTMAVNLTAHADLIRLVVPHMKRAGFGRIVNVASTESIVATAGIAAYSASKAGVTALTRSFAVELGRHGITVNCVCPGPVRTGMTAVIPEEAKESYARRRVPLRRYGEPEEVAHMTLSLCLPAASFVNGASVVVDGGMTIRHT